MAKAPLVSFSWGESTFFNSGSISAILDDGQGGMADVTLDFTDIPRGVALALLVPAVIKVRDTSPRSDDDEGGLAGVTIYSDLNGNGQLNPLNGPWTLKSETTTQDGTVLSDSFVFDDPKIPEVRAAINEIIFDDTKGDENHERGDHDRFTFGFERTFGDPDAKIVTGEVSHLNDGGGIINSQTLSITNSTLTGNVANDTNIAIDEDGQAFVDHNHSHIVTRDGPEMPGIGNTTHDFTSDFFV